MRKNAKDAESRVRRANNHLIDAAVALDTAEEKGANSPAVADALKELREDVTKLKKAKAEVKNPENDPFMKFGYGGTGSNTSIPVVQLSLDAVDRVLKPALGKSLTQLEAAIDNDMKPHSAPLAGWKAEGVTTIDRSPTRSKTSSACSKAKARTKDEIVVVGAHYDHLGRGGMGSLMPGSHEIHNGADDNASGTVSVLELARRFGQRGKKPPRKLVFMTFSGEEEGLIGSAYYVKNPVFPLNKTIAMINLDMVGRLKDDKLTVYGIGTAPHWEKLLKKLAPHAPAPPDPQAGGLWTQRPVVVLRQENPRAALLHGHASRLPPPDR